MLKKIMKNIYYSFPDSIKHGTSFKNTYEFLQKSQWWTEEQHREYQLKKVKELIKYSYENVPYYKRLFHENNILPSDINALEDLRKVPYLTKEIVMNNQQDLISKKYKKNELKYMVTGGSTGVPMGFYTDKKYNWKMECANVSSLWSRIGYNPKHCFKMAILRGNIPKKRNFEYIGNNLIMSSFNLKEENMDEYIKKLVEFQPDYIQAYPSTITLLAKHISENNIKICIKKLRAIICTSENLYFIQRKQLEDAFKVRVYSFYGHTEHCCLAGECENSSYYHLQSEYGYTELKKEDGNEALLEGEAGEIVCTGFNSYAFPFIRYKTGDIAINSNKKCTCGRNYKLIKKIEGREQEYFIDKSGSKITFTCSDDAVWDVKDKVYIYQYVQNEPGKVILFIQPKDSFIDMDINSTIKRFEKYYPDFNIEICFKENISRTKAGKFRFLVQNIKEV